MVKREFDEARQLPVAKQLTPAPVAPQYLSNPAPQPVPAGLTAPAQVWTQPVPQIDRAAEWAKAAQGRAEISKNRPTAPARPEFQKTVTPAQPAPADKPQSRADYWNQKAKEREAERPAQTRDRTRDRDYDRER